MFDPRQLSALGRGDLKMTVSTERSPDLGVSSYLAPRFACDLFDSVMSPHKGDHDGDSIAAESKDTPLRGMAWFLMTYDGELKYHIK